MNGHTWQTTPFPGSGTVAPYKFSEGASYDGVAAIGPRIGEEGVGDVIVYFTPDGDASQENEWECTELSKRFLFQEYGTRSLGDTYGNEVVNNYYNTYSSVFDKITNNGNAHVYPKPGDVVSYGSSEPGHTAVIKSVTDQSSGSATVQLIEQNASALGYVNQDFSNWQFQNGIENDPDNPDTISGWLTPKYNWSRNNPPNPTNATTLQITGMAATSPSDVWAVGYYYHPSLTYWTGYAAHFDGTNWTEYDTPRAGSQTNYYNLGVTNTSNGVYVVGYSKQGANPRYTTAYKWNAGTWSTVSTANPYTSSGGNVLTAVNSDSNGNMWAVGYGYKPVGGWKQAIIEQWDGSAFVGIASQPQTLKDSQFNAVSVSSSSNAWAVGQDYSSNQWRGYVWHYSNGSWAQDTNPNITTANVIANGVVALSDSEAWLTGTYAPNTGNQAGVVEHYVNSAWNNYTSITGPAFNAISANYENDVWVGGQIWTGYSGGLNHYAPYTYHWDGSSWSGSTLSTDDTADFIYAVTGTGYSTKVWMGGYHQYNPTSTTKYPEALVYQ